MKRHGEKGGALWLHRWRWCEWR